MIRKRFIKGMFALAAISVISAFAISLFSCQNEEAAVSQKSKNNAMAFMDKSVSLLQTFIQADVVVPGRGMRRVGLPALAGDTTSFTNKDGKTSFEQTKTVYVIYPEDTPLEVKNLYNQIMSVRDMVILEHVTAAEFSTLTPPDSTYAFQMSEDKVREELEPMTEASITYLQSFGFTKADLMDILKEANADTTALIPLALILAEQQINDAADEETSAYIYSPMSLFATPAYAAYNKMGVFVDCAMKAAIGVSLHGIEHLAFSEFLSRTALKTIVKKIALRTLGVIGTAIVIAEFINCMSESGKCVLATKNPSSLEGQLLDIVGGGGIPKDLGDVPKFGN